MHRLNPLRSGRIGWRSSVSATANADPAPVGPPVSRRSSPSRVGIPWRDAALLVLALVGCASFSGLGLFTVDESAYLSQARWVDEDGAWLQPYLVPDLGPGAEPAPLGLSTTTEDGWAAYGKAPLFILMLMAARGVHPDWGPVALSCLGLVLLAVASSALTARLAPASAAAARVAFWLAAGATPFLVHSQIVWAHTLAAAAATVGLVGLLIAWDGPRRCTGAILGASALAAVIMLRGEGVPFVAAVTVVYGVQFLRWRSAPALRATVVAGAGLVGGYVLNDVLVRVAVGSGSVARVPARSELLPNRLWSTWNNVFAPGRLPEPAVLARLVAVALLVFLAVRVRGGGAGGRSTVPLTVAAVMAGLAGATVVDPYAGLLPAVPLIVVGSLVMAPAQLQPRGAPMLAMAAVFAAAIVATSPPDAGGLGWGGRYLMMVLVFVVPLAAITMVEVWKRDEGGARLVLAAACAVTVAVQANGLWTLRQDHAGSRRAMPVVAADLERLRQQGHLLITTDLRVGRGAPEVARHTALLTVRSSELEQVLDSIHEQGLDAPLLVGYGPQTLPEASRWDATPVQELSILHVSALQRVES